jgi:methyl-accepting chemotaxis protein
MKRLLVVRIIGWLQLILSILLTITTIGVYLSYRSSLGDMSKSLASSVLSVSDVITKVATTIEVRQELIDDTAEVLVSSRKLVADMKSSAEAQATMLPRYVDSLRDTSTAMAGIGNTAVEISSSMQFKAPTSFHWQGLRPVLDWTIPLERHATALRKNGELVIRLSGNVASIAESVNTDAQKVNAGVIDMSQKTLKLIDHSVKATEKLKSQDLPHAISALKATADNLRQASAEAKGMEQFALSLLIAGLVLGVLFAFNSVGVLLIAETLSMGSAIPTNSVSSA